MFPSTNIINVNSSSIYDEYFVLHRKHLAEYGQSNTIVLMQVGVFYEMYGLRNVETGLDETNPNIGEFGRICELAVVPKSKVYYQDKKFNILMCGFKDDLVDKYVRKLQNAGYTTVLYNQSENAGKGVKREPRTLFGVISPGTYCGACDDSVASSTKVAVSRNTMMCVWFYLQDMQSSILRNASSLEGKKGTHKIHVGMSCVDIYTGNTVLYEFTRTYYPKLNNPNLFDPLDRFLTIQSPVEMVVLTENFDAKVALNSVEMIKNVKKIHYISLDEEDQNDNDSTSNTEINVNVKRAKNCEKQIYQREILASFYPNLTNNDIYMHKFDQYIFATQSFCYLLDFIHQHNTALTRQINLPTFDNMGDYLMLENSSLVQLNILDDGKQINAKYASVVKICTNEAQTPMGKRKITDMLLHPVIDPEYLRQEYNIVADTQVMCDENPDVMMRLSEKIGKIRDLAQYLRLIYWKRISPRQLSFLYESIQCIQEVYAEFSKVAPMNEYFQKNVDNYSNLLVAGSKITCFLDSVLNIDRCKTATASSSITTVGNELFIMKRTANAELNRNMTLLYESRDQLECCRTFFEGLLSKSGPSNKSSKKMAVKDEEDEDEVDADADAEAYSSGCNIEFGSNTNRFIKINCSKTNNYTLSSTELRCEEISEKLDELHSTSSTKAKADLHSFVNVPYVSSTTQQESTFQLKIGKEHMFSNKKGATSASASAKVKSVIEFAKPSSKSSTRLIKSSQIDECAYTLSAAKKTISDTIRRAYLDVLGQLEKYDGELLALTQYMAMVDSILTRVRLATKNGYCRPELAEPTQADASASPSSFVYSKNLRHPIIEKILTDDFYVANDVSLDSRGILLYGVNAVGKTSLIRSLGIAVIMAQAGFFVSASEFRYYPYTKLFTRILGNDSLAKGLSTFVVEMLELNPILQYADERSIVLGDELCSGTETPSAISLNMASLVRLCKRNVSFILATHYHELSEMEEIQSLSNLDIMHMAMYYDANLDKLVYNRKLQPGIGSSRYGLEVCKALKMPDDFLDYANELRVKYYAKTGGGSILDYKTSVYNSKHVRGMCQKCGKVISTEVHHVLPQNLADKNGLIMDEQSGSTIHKNHPANLMSVCEKCHLDIHHG